MGLDESKGIIYGQHVETDGNEKRHPGLKQVQGCQPVYLLCCVPAAACACTPPETVREFVGIVDAGVVRPLALAVPGCAAGLRFGQLCLRKLYVLASRGAEASSPQGCLLQVCDSHPPCCASAS